MGRTAWLVLGAIVGGVAALYVSARRELDRGQSPEIAANVAPPAQDPPAAAPVFAEPSDAG